MVSNKNYLHSRACKCYLERGRNLERYNGYHIHLWCKEYLDKLDFQTQNFWVAKKTIGKIHRGQKIFSTKKKKTYESQGGKVREITCFKKETRKAMRKLLPFIDISADWQHGFTNQKDIFTQFQQLCDFAIRKNFQVSVVSMDLEDAFHQITEEQVYCIFRFIFRVNKKQSSELAHKCCIKGRLFQGNTLAPILFNIWFSRFYSIIERNIQGNNVLITSYADDITMITSYRSISWKFMKFIQKLIENIGFKINKAKTRVRNGKNMEACGLQFKFNKFGEWKVMPRSMKGLNNNLRLWEHLKRLGITTTLRLNSKGELITIQEMEKGLMNWKTRIQNFQPLT